jgi:hypothetical protein
MEESAARDFAERAAEILNWNPTASLRFNDRMLGLTQFVKPHSRGIGGLIRYSWHDFRGEHVCRSNPFSARHRGSRARLPISDREGVDVGVHVSHGAPVARREPDGAD